MAAPTQPPTLFVHATGASQAPETMQWIEASLGERGYPSITPNLPTDKTGCDFDAVAESLADAIESNAEDHPVALVAYSQAGNCAVRAALALEERGSRISKEGLLRIILVGAGLERTTTKHALGRPFDDETHPEKNTLVSRATIQTVTDQVEGYHFDEDDKMTIFSADTAGEILYPEADESRRAKVIAMLRPHYRPDTQPEMARWPRVPIDSIVCLNDLVVKRNYQIYMASNVLQIEYVPIVSDHSPHISHDRELAAMLIAIAERPAQTAPTRERSIASLTYWKQGEGVIDNVPDPEQRKNIVQARTLNSTRLRQVTSAVSLPSIRFS